LFAANELLGGDPAHRPARSTGLLHKMVKVHQGPSRGGRLRSWGDPQLHSS